MSNDAVDTLRRFNRSWTQRIGVLDDSFLGSGRPLGPSRLLFEIGAEGLGVRELRERLGLDSGYVSRLLRRLEDEGLVEVHPDPADARRRVVKLTADGKVAHRDLDDRSEDLARSLVEPMSKRQRSALAEHLGQAERLIRAATVSLDVVDPASPRALAAVAAYLRELDETFSEGFDAGEAAHDHADLSGAGRFVVAVSDGVAVGCGGLRHVDTETAEIKRMWVDRGWRGLGLAGRLLRRLEEEAAALGHKKVWLDTNRALTPAIAMYRAAGYTDIARYNDNPYADFWFEKRL
jgi:DNA-binding MarR family transcriptional regulator/GNAT superfamily N-acetyltransferase